MKKILRQIGINENIAAIMMIAFGIVIYWRPDLLARLIAIYLVIVGIVKLLPE